MTETKLPRPYYDHAGITIYTGDCREVLPLLEPRSVHSVVTSPPYAEQRKELYGGIPEADYPEWTVSWMAAVERVLVTSGSVLINIREHVQDGQISDYVHRTRLAVRAAGWFECDELIWVKQNGAPLGHSKRPRRDWERILWFSRDNQPWCDAKANGRQSNRATIYSTMNRRAWVHSGNVDKAGSVIARCSDVVTAHLGSSRTCVHPAAYPPELARWMARLVTPPGGTVLDPFFGSGSTGVGAQAAGFQCIGIEQRPDYCEIASRRFAQEVLVL